MKKHTVILLGVIFGFILVGCFACKTTKLDPKNPTGSLIVRLTRTPCYGRCPTYEITIYDDGLLLYDGKQNVEKQGKYFRKLEKSEVQNLKTAFANANFFQLANTFPETEKVPTDLPSCIVYFKDKDKGEEKTITDHRWKTPELLSVIEKSIDSLAASKLLHFYDK